MRQSNRDFHGHTCVLAHNLVNRLSVIIGCCDLIDEGSELTPEDANRLATIRNVAKLMAEELNEHQSELAAVVSKSPTPFIPRSQSEENVNQ